ncbi:hypothetical protein HDV00_007554 [Rhizophlyctis rosea]|nr:hypothetical protein HDV00_007554 [Rhizophlyctis rosea]
MRNPCDGVKVKEVTVQRSKQFADPKTAFENLKMPPEFVGNGHLPGTKVVTPNTYMKFKEKDKPTYLFGGVFDETHPAIKNHMPLLRRSQELLGGSYDPVSKTFINGLKDLPTDKVRGSSEAATIGGPDDAIDHQVFSVAKSASRWQSRIFNWNLGRLFEAVLDMFRQIMKGKAKFAHYVLKGARIIGPHGSEFTTGQVNSGHAGVNAFIHDDDADALALHSLMLCLNCGEFPDGGGNLHFPTHNLLYILKAFTTSSLMGGFGMPARSHLLSSGISLTKPSDTYALYTPWWFKTPYDHLDDAFTNAAAAIYSEYARNGLMVEIDEGKLRDALRPFFPATTSSKRINFKYVANESKVPRGEEMATKLGTYPNIPKVIMKNHQQFCGKPIPKTELRDMHRRLDALAEAHLPKYEHLDHKRLPKHDSQGPTTTAAGSKRSGTNREEEGAGQPRPSKRKRGGKDNANNSTESNEATKPDDERRGVWRQNRWDLVMAGGEYIADVTEELRALGNNLENDLKQLGDPLDETFNELVERAPWRKVTPIETEPSNTINQVFEKFDDHVGAWSEATDWVVQFDKISLLQKIVPATMIWNSYAAVGAMWRRLNVDVYTAVEKYIEEGDLRPEILSGASWPQPLIYCLQHCGKICAQVKEPPGEEDAEEIMEENPPHLKDLCQVQVNWEEKTVEFRLSARIIAPNRVRKADDVKRTINIAKRDQPFVFNKLTGIRTKNTKGLITYLTDICVESTIFPTFRDKAIIYPHPTPGQRPKPVTQWSTFEQNKKRIFKCAWTIEKKLGDGCWACESLGKWLTDKLSESQGDPEPVITRHLKLMRLGLVTRMKDLKLPEVSYRT